MSPLPGFLNALALPPRAAKRATSSRRGPRAQLAGSIEDMPAELIPATTTSVPEHWRRAGVYGVYSTTGALQYVAAVEDVHEAISNHIRYIESAADRYAVRMVTVDDAATAPLGQIAETWVLTHTAAAGVPPGNGDAAPEWRLEKAPSDIYLRTGAEDEFLEEEIKRAIRGNGVVVFMKGVRETPRCGFSAFVVDVVKGVIGEEFVCVDCLDERNGGIRDGIKRFSGWPTLPQLYVDGEFVGGADIVREMAVDGSLEGLLKKAVERRS